MPRDLRTSRQRIYDYIVEYKRGHDGNSPSLREIGEACHLVISVVKSHLDRLERDGWINRISKESRGIEVVGGQWQLYSEAE